MLVVKLLFLANGRPPILCVFVVSGFLLLFNLVLDLAVAHVYAELEDAQGSELSLEQNLARSQH